jgi:hypothetical protein
LGLEREFAFFVENGMIRMDTVKTICEGGIQKMAQTTIYQQEQDLFSEWKEKRPNIIYDGVVNETEYAKCNPKIVYLLKEVNGEPADGKGWDLRDLLNKARTKEEEASIVPTFNNITRWTYGIRSIFENPDAIITSKQIAIVDNDFRREQLKYIAVMNVKKVSGLAAASNSAIKRYASEDEKFLLRQLRIYSPQIVICCGTDECYPIDLSWDKTANGVEYAIDGETVVISFKHPNRKAKKLTFVLIDAIKEICKTQSLV